MSDLARRSIAGGSEWEPRVGYARAVRAGDLIFVSGTVAEGADAYQQAKAAIATIEGALREAGAELGDVVRTRLFVTNLERDREAIGRAHREAFAAVRPACSMIGVAGLIEPEYLVEIEVDAVVG